jgi:hypothetical protein
VFGLLAGVGLAAPYWLPAIVEFAHVQWLAPAQPLPALALAALFALPGPLDANTLVYQPDYSLGLPLLVASALVGVFGLLRFMRARRLPAVPLLALAAIGTLALLAPPHSYLLVMLYVLLALCLAQALEALLGARRWAARALVAAVGVTLLASWSVWSSPLRDGRALDTSTRAIARYEVNQAGIAVVPATSAAPIARGTRAVAFSAATPPLDTASGQWNTRFEALSLADGVIGASEHRSEQEIANVLITQPSRLVIEVGYDPGWEVWYGGRRMPTERASDGTLLAWVDSGERGALVLLMGATPTRIAAWAIASGCVLVLVVLTRARPHRQMTYTGPASAPDREAEPLLAGIALLFACTLALTAVPGAPLSLRPAPGHSLAGSSALNLRTDPGSIELLSYRLADARPAPGASLELTLYWRARTILSSSYVRTLTLVRVADGTPFTLIRFTPPGNVITSRWLIDRLVPDAVAVQLPASLVPGAYLLAIDMMRCIDLTCGQHLRAQWIDAQGTPFGERLVLPVTVTIGTGG